MRKDSRSYLKVSIIVLVLTFIILYILPALQTIAKTASNSKIEAMLVLDASKSMDASDKEKISQEAMKLFVDMASTQGDKIGIVTYTDVVVREKAMLEIDSQQDKEDLKNFINELTRGPWTDISIGLNEAIKILDSSHTEGYIPLIILLADGNNDVNKNSSRTVEQANKELQEGKLKAKEKGYPVYTIGLNADRSLNEKVLKNISDETGGKFFSTASSADLPAILSTIFADHLKLKVQAVNSFKANGDFQDVNVTIPNSNVAEANISVMSNKPVELKLLKPNGNEVTIPSKEVLYSKSKKYSMIKILKPVTGDWLLKVKGVKEDQIDINLIYDYDFQLKMEKLNATYKKGETIDVTAFLESNGEKILSEENYKQMNGTLLVNDKETNETTEVVMKHDAKKGFVGTFALPNEHPYELKVRVEDDSFYRETEPVQINNGEKSEEVPAPPPDVKEESSFPWSKILTIVGGIIVLLILFLVIKKVRGNGGKQMVGQFGLEIRDNDTFESESPQYRELGIFTSKTNFHQIMGFRQELSETKDIVFHRQNDHLLLINQSRDCTVEKDGELIESTQKEKIMIGDKFTIKLSNVNKTIFVNYIN